MRLHVGNGIVKDKNKEGGNEGSDGEKIKGGEERSYIPEICRGDRGVLSNALSLGDDVNGVRINIQGDLTVFQGGVHRNKANTMDQGQAGQWVKLDLEK